MNKITKILNKLNEGTALSIKDLPPDIQKVIKGLNVTGNVAKWTEDNQWGVGIRLSTELTRGDLTLLLKNKKFIGILGSTMDVGETTLLFSIQ